MSSSELSSVRKICRRGPTKYARAARLLREGTHSKYLEPEQIRDSLNIEFCNDYDLAKLRMLAASKIYHEAKSVPKLEQEINNCKEKLENFITPNERRDIENQIAELTKRCTLFSEPNRLADFERQAASLLSEYAKIPPPRNVVDIMNGGERIYHPDDNDIRRISVITEFFQLVNPIIRINHNCTGYTARDIVQYCNGCGCILNVNRGDIHIICNECGSQNYATIKAAARSSESEKKYKSKRRGGRSYEDITNFKKALLRYMCVTVPKVDLEELSLALDNHFTNLGRGHREFVNHYELDARGQRPGTSIGMMIDALMATNYSDFYKDVRYIAHYYWGWERPNISHLEDTILSDYRKTQKVWSEMSDTEKGRKSSMSVEYRLLKHLQLRGHICYVSDFKMPQTDSIQTYETLWKTMCELCDDPEIYFKPI